MVRATPTDRWTPQEAGMLKSVRSVALVAVAAFALSACGLLSSFIPPQEIDGGVLGLGGGVDVALTPPVTTASLQTLARTTWVGTLTESFALDGLGADIPNFVSPKGLAESIDLGDTIVVRNAFDTGEFTVTGLQLGGTFTVGTTTYPLPAGAVVTGLSVLFDDPVCVDAAAGGRECTYTTAQNVPSVGVQLLQSHVQAYWNLLKAGGGTVSANLTVTVTLANPGLPEDATVTVTLESAGATISF
jgi:hypothetical protein